MVEPLRIALAGTGSIAARGLAPALHATPHACLWSVLSRDKSRGLEFARTHGARSPDPAHDAVESLLADPRLDAVLIATPDALHADLARACANAGKHVLCEKPLTTQSRDAYELDALFRAKGLTLAVAYHMRFHAGHRALHARVRAGELGRVLHVRVQWGWAAPDAQNWRAHDRDAGRWWALAAMGTHAFDLVRWFIPESEGPLESITSVRSSPVWRAPREEVAVVAMRFASGATAEVMVSMAFRVAPCLEITGTLGVARADGTLGPRGAGSIAMLDAPLHFEVRDPYQGEVDDFVRAVRTRTEPEVSGRQGADNVHWIERACGEGG